MDQGEIRLNLAKRTNTIRCPKHSERILFLNTDRGVSQENRIICENCPIKDRYCQTNQTLEQVELSLKLIFQQEQSLFYQAKLELMKVINCIKQCIDTIDIQIRQMLAGLRTKIQYLEQGYSNHHSQITDTPLKKLIDDLKYNTKPLDISKLEQICQLLSESKKQTGGLEDKTIQNQVFKLFLVIENLFTVYKLDQTKIQEVRQQIQDLESTSGNLNNTITNWKNPFELSAHNANVRSVAISQDDNLLASGDSQGLICIWSLREKQLFKQFNGDQGQMIQDLAFSKQNNILGVSQYSSYLQSDILIFQLDKPDKTPIYRLKGHSRSVWRIQFTDNSQHLLSGGDDSKLRLWDLNQMKMIHEKNLYSRVNGISLSPNQQIVLCGCGNGKAYLFDQLCQTEKKSWQTNEGYIAGTSFTQDSKKIILAHKKKITLWEVSTINKLREFQTNSETWSVIAHLSQTLFISNDGKLKIWNLESGEQLKELDVPGGYEQSFDKQVAITSDCKYMVTGGKNQKVKVYERSD